MINFNQSIGITDSDLVTMLADPVSFTIGAGDTAFFIIENPTGVVISYDVAAAVPVPVPVPAALLGGALMLGGVLFRKRRSA